MADYAEERRQINGCLDEADRAHPGLSLTDAKLDKEPPQRWLAKQREISDLLEESGKSPDAFPKGHYTVEYLDKLVSLI
jgi:hypothetical protein